VKIVVALLQCLLHYYAMTKSKPIFRIPESALEEFNLVEAMDWSDGVRLPDLIAWVNMVAERFRPASIGGGSRASAEFSERTFRHYQTLGCIDAPERDGKQVVYRFRQYVQALLLRRLLWENLPSAAIATVMAGRTTAELKQLLLEGIEILPRSTGKGKSRRTDAGRETWNRIVIAPGVELHLREGLKRPDEKQLRQWLRLLEELLANP
jgi:DNA-binding transcriptional MerR regulator